MPHHESPAPHHESPAPHHERQAPRRDGRGPDHEAPAGPAGSPGTEMAAILPAVRGPDGQFGHRQHIHLAFLAVRRYGMPAATGKICTWIRHVTAQAPQKYHHTVSRAWVEIVAHHITADPECTDFDIFVGRHPALLDKRLLSSHYRSVTLASQPARRGWVEPDLVPFPWSARDESGPGGHANPAAC